MIRPSSVEWYILGILIIGLIGIILIAEKLRSVKNWPIGITRKFVHIFTGILIFFTPYLFRSPFPLILLSLLFVIANYAAIRFRLFQGMHGTVSPSYGTVFYPLTFFLLLLLFWQRYPIIIQLSILTMATSDAFAAIVGENVKSPTIYRLTSDPKSFEGSAAMAVTTFLILFAGLAFLYPSITANLSIGTIFWFAILGAIIATIAEAISYKGSDNLSAPLSTAFILHFMLTHSSQGHLQLTIGMVLAFFVAFLSYRFQFLDKSGAGTVFLMGTVIFGIGDLRWGLPVIVFFVSSSLLSKLWKERKIDVNLIYEKSSRRDAGQVLANGGVATLAILIYYASGNHHWYLMFLGALAAVTADTWATEIGILSRKDPRMITTFQQVVPGSSGAISLTGTFGSVLGALFVALVGYMIHPTMFIKPGLEIAIITSAGFLAALMDSLIGATLQSQFRCFTCQKITEKANHCNHPTSYEKGIIWINNDIVNIFCGSTGLLYVFIVISLI